MRLSDYGITRLSPTSLAAWANSPSMWCLKYLFGWRDHGGPALYRGTCIESGLVKHLYDPNLTVDDIYPSVLSQFTKELQGEVGPEVESEIKILKPMLYTAIRGAKEKGLGQPDNTQARCTAHIPIDNELVEVAGYIDILYTDRLIELKTTKSMPPLNKPRSEHKTQGAFYRWASNMLPLELMYVTDKRVVFCEITDEDVEKEISLLKQHAQSLVRCLKAFDKPEQMLGALPPAGKFRLTDEALAFREKMLND